jgi:hypothetical protein
VVTLCVPLLGYYLQAGELHPAIFAACLLPSVLQFAMLLAIELPDAAGDASPASARWWCGWARPPARGCTRR